MASLHNDVSSMRLCYSRQCVSLQNKICHETHSRDPGFESLLLPGALMLITRHHHHHFCRQDRVTANSRLLTAPSLRAFWLFPGSSAYSSRCYPLGAQRTMSRKWPSSPLIPTRPACITNSTMHTSCPMKTLKLACTSHRSSR